MKKIMLLLASFVLVFTVAGCGKEKKEVIKIDEKALVEKILGNEEAPMLQEADEETLKNTFGLNPDDYESQYTKFSLVNISAINVSVVKAKEGKVEAIKAALEKRSNEVKKSFEQYRIEPAYTTSKNGEVIVKDDYVILLMVEKKDEALKIIDETFSK